MLDIMGIMTSIVFIADTHGAHREIDVPKADILIHCGDFMTHGNIGELNDFNAWLGELPHSKKVVCAGNHDWAMERMPKEAQALLTNCIYLQDNKAKVGDLTVYCSPWSPRFCDWAFNLDYWDAEAKWDLIYPDTDILVTHGPPHGILDRTREGRDVGCPFLMKKILNIRPKIHAFGHIHEGFGRVNKYGVRFVNASIMTRDYEPKNRAMLCKI